MKGRSEANLSDLYIPTPVFTLETLTTFEALVKYLKEERLLSYREIGELLDRDERNIWTIYHRAQEKKITKEIQKNRLPQFLVPSAIFLDNKLTTFEALVEFLKEKKGLSYRTIATILQRDERNIWTVYHRAKLKRNDERQD